MALRASRIPGTATMGPIETIGFEGATSTTSASSIAASTSGVGRDSSMPWSSTPRTGTSARCLIQYSWKWTTSSRPSMVVAMCVSTSASVIGSKVTPMSHRRHSSAVASVRVRPSRRRAVRTRWVARSRSPSPNQA